MSPMPLLLLLLCLYLRARAFQTTVCDCAEPLNMGIIQFPDADCKPKMNSTSAVPVRYAVYSDERAAVKFPGFICAKWRNIHRVTMNFFGQTVIVPEKIPIDTTASECYKMINTKKCEGYEMTLSDEKYVFSHEPRSDGYWMRTVDWETLNCALEQVQLFQQMEDEDFPTPIGKASSTAGTLSHNHLTLVWDTTYTHKVQHELRTVESGTGNLMMKTINEKYFRLLDDDRQLDFHLTLQPPCDPNHRSCNNRTTTFKIVGQSNLVLVTWPFVDKSLSLTAESASNKEKAQPSVSVETTSPSSDPDLDKLANKQYIQDRAIDRDNELARMLQTIECDVRKAKNERAIITAQYNGWLAASLLKLPRCAKLQAFGQTAVVIQCKAVNATFETIITPCGPQPKFNNYTINLDGWELVKFSPCYWTNGFVNFNDKPYAFRNNTWKRIDPNIVPPERTLAHSFRYEDVKAFDYDHRSNPAYNDNLLNHMNVVADIVAAMNEQSPADFPSNHRPHAADVLLTAAGVERYTSWWEVIIISLVITVISILVLIVLRICCCLGLFGICCPPIKEVKTSYHQHEV
uniref:Retrovirus-related Pol polyprotein from transposon n=1 Tax=Daphnia magna TaxID=35525 RepID=A0A0N8AEJ0_9CRUS